jgi:hypothetical protein
MATLSETNSILSERREAPGLIASVADLVPTLKALFDPYRPERYYMRGPGPKWHAKHGSAAGSAEALPLLLRSAKA